MSLNILNSQKIDSWDHPIYLWNELENCLKLNKFLRMASLYNYTNLTQDVAYRL